MPRKSYRFGQDNKIRCKRLVAARKENITCAQNNSDESNEAVVIVDYEQNISDSNVNDAGEADDINSSNGDDDNNTDNTKSNDTTNDKLTSACYAHKAESVYLSITN
ncbi:hypothetical protein SNE40_003869 [Patella caerulea]|uniref:Uncharacterized protein n=1 Tax=Patella caerulea TaxID=87958 RepID=A0AAN8Q1A8_PATCE